MVQREGGYFARVARQLVSQVAAATELARRSYIQKGSLFKTSKINPGENSWRCSPRGHSTQHEGERTVAAGEYFAGVCPAHHASGARVPDRSPVCRRRVGHVLKGVAGDHDRNRRAKQLEGCTVHVPAAVTARQQDTAAVTARQRAGRPSGNISWWTLGRVRHLNLPRGGIGGRSGVHCTPWPGVTAANYKRHPKS